MIAPNASMPFTKYIGLLQKSWPFPVKKLARVLFMSNLDGLVIPMTMGDWVLIMESVASKLIEMESVDPESMDEDDLADLYTDQQNRRLI